MLAHLLFGDGEQGTALPYSRSLLGAVSGLATTESLPCSGDPSWAPGVGGRQREVRVLLGVLQIKDIRRSEAKGRETRRENFREVKTSLHMPLTTPCNLNPVPYVATSQLWEQVSHLTSSRLGPSPVDWLLSEQLPFCPFMEISVYTH